MINSQTLLALVPARGGSKRLPRKNILSFLGQPLISWTIQAGLESKFVDRLVVSTEDVEISEVSKKWGADVPFLRRGELATDSAETFDVILDVLMKLDALGERYDYLLLLQPTSPLRTTHHIDESIKLLLEKKANSVISVTEIDHPIEWTSTLPIDLSMDEFFSSPLMTTRSQNYPTRYRLNGAIYLLRISCMLSNSSLFLKNGAYAYKMEKQHSIDIDTVEDFIFAETIATNRELKS